MSRQAQHSYKMTFMVKCFETGQLLLRLIFCFSILVLIIISLKELALAQPQSLESLAKVFEALRMDSITCYVLGVMGLVYGALERVQKKQLQDTIRRLQNELENRAPEQPAGG